MIAAVVPIYVIALCNMSHIVLAIFFFPSIVEFLDDLHWGFTHRSWFVDVDDSETDLGEKRFINHSKHSILIDKADRYEKVRERPDIVNYYAGEDRDFEEYLSIRENLKMLQQAADDAILIRKQNFRARAHQRFVDQHANGKRTLVRTR